MWHSSTRGGAVSCVDGRCQVALAGVPSQTVGVLGQELVISNIHDGSASVTVAGEKRSLSVGETVTAGGLAIRLEEATRSMSQARLVITRAAKA
jgi:hypothetical protein